jgi:hypothetical protein
MSAPLGHTIDHATVDQPADTTPRTVLQSLQRKSSCPEQHGWVGTI